MKRAKRKLIKIVMYGVKAKCPYCENLEYIRDSDEWDCYQEETTYCSECGKKFVVEEDKRKAMKYS